MGAHISFELTLVSSHSFPNSDRMFKSHSIGKCNGIRKTFQQLQNVKGGPNTEFGTCQTYWSVILW